MVAREGKKFYEQIMEKLFVEDCGKKPDFARKLIVVIKAKLWSGSKLALSKTQLLLYWISQS